MTPKLQKLYELFNSVASDFGLEIVLSGTNEMPWRVNYGGASRLVTAADD